MTRNWSKIMDREVWKRIVEQVKTYRVPRKEEEDNRNH
jgi:hypothetical protein